MQRKMRITGTGLSVVLFTDGELLKEKGLYFVSSYAFTGTMVLFHINDPYLIAGQWWYQ